MDNNYWQEYWDNYYKFMAVYLGGLQANYDNVDMKKEYLEVSRLFEPPMTPEGYNNSTQNNTNMPTNDALSTEYYTMPGMGNNMQQGILQIPIPFISTGAGQTPESFISPGGGQFTINNCKKVSLVRIEMRRGFNPNTFYMLVDSADRRSIQGFRIACQNNQIRFVPMAIDYRNINVIECVF